MEIVKADLWEVKCGLTLVTGNGVIKKDGSLVMGAGSAKQMLSLFPDIDYQFGADLVRNAEPYRFTNIRLYGITVTYYRKASLGLFQTKLHYNDEASLSLIGYSLTKLRQLWYGGIGIDTTVAMPYPGIGLGRLEEKKVRYLLEDMEPYNLTICKR